MVNSGRTPTGETLRWRLYAREVAANIIPPPVLTSWSADGDASSSVVAA